MFVSVAVLTVGVAALIVHSAPATTGRVTVTVWPPASLFGDPADFRLAHQAAKPVTAVFFLDNDVTAWTFHGFSILQ